MPDQLHNVVNIDKNPVNDDQFRQQCKISLDAYGVLLLPDFITEHALMSLRDDGGQNCHKAFFTQSDHTVYLRPFDSAFSESHSRNRTVSSSKGCITTDQIPGDSALHSLYHNNDFKDFLCAVLNETQLHQYGDPLSSINLHYASDGQELGWHFDNSSFAITLLIQAPEDGGEFQYVRDARDADAGDMNYTLTGEILNGQVPTDSVDMQAGSLVLFRGRNSIHRVTPTKGDTTRMLAVLAYNTEPDISLSESARMTFYGRLS